MKRGRFSKIEHQYIADNASLKSYVDIAKTLDRDPEAVKAQIEKLGMTATLSSAAVYMSDVTNREFWPELQLQFSEGELTMFKYQWDQMHAQFGKDNVLPTEELQIIDTIKLDIFMNRAAREIHKGAAQIKEMEDNIHREKALGEDQDKVQLAFYERQLSFYRSAQGALGKEYREIQEKKGKMFDALKATRSARINRVENSRESFKEWLSEIINNEDRRVELGRRMEKMRLAVIDEEIRLAAYHKYEDGKIDQPLLTPETVKVDK